MSLDLFNSNIDDAVAHAARVSAPELPSTFSDNFNDAWTKGYLTSQSISGEIRKTSARQGFVDDAIAKTGDQSFAQSGEGGGFDVAGFNAKVARHRAERPDIDLQPMSDEAVQARADEIGTRQLADSASFDKRERTTGGSVGSFLGTAAAAVADPVNLIAFPLAAPESLGILGTALAWGGIGAGSQTVIEALNARSMERIQPGYGDSGETIHNILGAGVGGAVLGGGFKGLSALWSRAKAGQWPRTVRDAGNVVDSEAQIAATNPFVYPESISSAAIRYGGKTYEGALHSDAYELAAQQTGAEFGNVIGATKPQDAGFVTNTGRFVDREEAARIANTARQTTHHIDDLAAENLPDDYFQIANAATIQGEAAHRTALNKAIDDLANGRPVDVEGIVTPEQFATRTNAIDDVMALRADAINAERAAADARNAVDGKAQPGLPFEATHLDTKAELFGGSVADSIRKLAPGMTPEDAALLAGRITKLPDEQARAVLGEAAMRPSTLAHTVVGDVAPPNLKAVPSGAQITGESAHGPVLDGVQGRYADAVAWLRGNQTGDALGVLAHPDIPGRIDIVWGNTAGGLAHIIDKHPSIVPVIPDVLPGLPVQSASKNRIILDDGNYKAVIRLDDNGVEKTWLLTAFERKSRRSEGSTESQADLGDRLTSSPVPPGDASIAASRELANDLTPAKIEEARLHPDMEETVARDLDKLMLERPDMEVPTGVTVDAEGRTVPSTRKVEDVVAEADARSAAAKEIEACVGPYPAAEPT